MLTQTLCKEIVEEAERMDLSFDDCLSKAYNSVSIQKKVDLVFKAAVGKAEKTGNTKDLKEKRNPFYNALKEGSELVGLNGKWFSMVINVAGWSQWSMFTDMYKCKMTDGADGCKYYAVYSE